MNKILNIVLVIVLILFGIVAWKMISQENATSFGYSGYNDLGYDGVTNTVVTSSAAVDADAGDNTILNANAARKYARLQNIGTTLVTLQLDSATSTLAVTKGILLATTGAASVYKIGPDNLYIGAIMGLASGTTGTISVVEK